MNTTEHLLSCLAEECAEVGQACSKAMRFGPEDKGPNHELTNAQYIASEMTDVIAVFELLVEHLQLPLPNPYLSEAVNHKKDKVRHYMDYARQRGTLQDDNVMGFMDEALNSGDGSYRP